MSEPIVEPNANGEPTPAPPVAKYTEEERNAAAAAARREAEAKLAETNKRLAELEAEKKEREEAELTELELTKKTIEELNAQVEQLTPFKETVEKQVADTKERVEKKLLESDLDDDEKQLVLDSPVQNQLALIDKLVTAKTVTPPATPGKIIGGVGDPKKDEILAMPDGPAKIAAWKKFRMAGGI